jgi:hypothetical protein
MKKISLVIGILAGLTTTGFAQPAYMNYQGRLLDPAGQPLANGVYTLEFKVYDSANGANLIWGPFLFDDGAGAGHAGRAIVANGRFNVILGPGDTAGRSLTNAFLADDRFVEITVNGGSPILPRQQVLSAPYALRAAVAANADKLNQLPPSDYFLPPGMVVPFAGTNSIPAGWLLCDGAQVSRTVHSRLFAAIGTAWGAGNGSSTFNLPDLRGMFLRGVTGSRTGVFADPDRNARTNSAPGGLAGNNVGSVQTNALQNVTGSVGTFNRYSAFHGDPTGPFLRESGGQSTSIGAGSGTDTWEPISFDLSRSARTSSETRPNNAYVHYIIKY